MTRAAEEAAARRARARGWVRLRELVVTLGKPEPQNGEEGQAAAVCNMFVIRAMDRPGHPGAPNTRTQRFLQ